MLVGQVRDSFRAALLALRSRRCFHKSEEGPRQPRTFLFNRGFVLIAAPLDHTNRWHVIEMKNVGQKSAASNLYCRNKENFDGALSFIIEDQFLNLLAA